jgi:hypothetical protein
MMLIAERRDDGRQAEAAPKQIKRPTRWQARARTGNWRRIFKAQLRETQVIRDRLKGR